MMLRVSRLSLNSGRTEVLILWKSRTEKKKWWKLRGIKLLKQLDSNLHTSEDVTYWGNENKQKKKKGTPGRR